MQKRASLFLAVASFAAFAAIALARRPDTSPADAHKLVAAGARLLDVRTPEEFAGGHLPGAINIPVDELEGRVAEVGPRDQPVVVYCSAGVRSAAAARALARAGFTAVHDLGAMSHW